MRRAPTPENLQDKAVQEQQTAQQDRSQLPRLTIARLCFSFVLCPDPEEPSSYIEVDDGLVFRRCQCTACKGAYNPMPIWMWPCNIMHFHFALSGQLCQCSCAAMTCLELYSVLQCQCSSSTGSLWQVHRQCAWQPLSQPRSIMIISIRVLFSSHIERPYEIVHIIVNKSMMSMKLMFAHQHVDEISPSDKHVPGMLVRKQQTLFSSCRA